MKVLLVPSDMQTAMESARILKSRLTVAGIDTEIQPPQDESAPAIAKDELSLVVPMGGDGTFLHAARLIDFDSIPLLGLNYGRLGFLSGSPERDEVELIEDALSGDLAFEHRSTLDAEVVTMDGVTHHCTALNEFAYTRGSSGHMVGYSYSVNGIHVAELAADGVIVSSATGSTAYALSAGGPIVSPGYNGMLVVPVAPHSLNARAVVLAPSDVLEITIQGRYPEEASLFIDGRVEQDSAPEYMKITRGEKEVLFARGGGDFFTNISRVFFR